VLGDERCTFSRSRGVDMREEEREGKRSEEKGEREETERVRQQSHR